MSDCFEEDIVLPAASGGATGGLEGAEPTQN